VAREIPENMSWSKRYRKDARYKHWCGHWQRLASATIISSSSKVTLPRVCTAIQETIKGAMYLISVVTGPSNPKDFEPFFIAAFNQKLWPMLDEPKPKVFLFQAGMMAPNLDGSTPFLGKMMTKQHFDDNVKAVQFMIGHPKISTNVMVSTRPTRPLKEDNGAAGQRYRKPPTPFC
jgi:hypothetical protein